MIPNLGTPGIAHAIQLAVAPVFLLSGVAALLAVITNRLARIVDRARDLEPIAQAEGDIGRRARAELRVIAQRGRVVSWSIALCTLTALLIAAVIALMFIGAFFAFDASVPVALLFIAAMGSMIAALALFLREVHLGAVNAALRWRHLRRAQSPRSGLTAVSRRYRGGARIRATTEPAMTRPDLVHDTASALARILERCPQHIVVAAPLGLGKPNRLLNAVYRARRATTPVVRCSCSPHCRWRGRSRSRGWRRASRSRSLSATSGPTTPISTTCSICVPGEHRRTSACTNSSLPVRCLARCRSRTAPLRLDQLHPCREGGARPDPAADGRAPRRSAQPVVQPRCHPGIVERMAANGQARPYVVAVVHPQLPFLGNDAEVGLDFADLLVEDPGESHRLFALPREPVLPSEHAIGLHAASLVKDGGTLQIGIGALSDAIVHALLWRDRDAAAFDRSVRALGAQRSERLPYETAKFERGLYGASEMVMDGFMHLRRAGILRRHVFDDLGLQRLLNSGAIAEVADASTIDRCIEAGLVAMQLDRPSLDWLQKFGLVDARVDLVDGELAIRN